MIDFEKILSELRTEAGKLADEVDLDSKLDAGKQAASDVRERLETDPKARMAAMGAGGLLLAGLIGSRGGRRLVGSVAKTGAVAALGALAYRAWQTRNGEAAAGPQEADLGALGYAQDTETGPKFAEALVRIMIAAAHADGEFDSAEQAAIATALDKAGVSAETRDMLMTGGTEIDAFDAAVLAARTPNHAAQLYAAASATVSDNNAAEQAFLGRLAGRLGLGTDYARSIDRAARSEPDI